MQAVENLSIIMGMISPEHHVNCTAHAQGKKMIAFSPMESPLVVQLHQEQNNIEGRQWHMNEPQSDDNEYETYIH
jgi:hypothetical protein